MHCRAGDSVVVTARSTHGVRTTVRELQSEMKPGISVKGTACETCTCVCRPDLMFARLRRARECSSNGPPPWRLSPVLHHCATALTGFDVDVSSPASIARLASLAKDHLGGIDVWINNAGYSGSFQVCVQTYSASIKMPHCASVDK
jgi:NAD(P)-dependent dehydrogenase (short-subunit alcohol dehydrogenase family)